MKISRHQDEILILTNAGEILHVFMPRGTPFSPTDFEKGTMIFHELPVTVIDLGDKMKDQPDLKAVNKWVTDKRMLALMDLAEKVLKTPIKGLSIDTSLQLDDAEIISRMLLGQIKDESKGKLIFTDATTEALKDAAKTWFLNYLKEKPQ